MHYADLQSRKVRFHPAGGSVRSRVALSCSDWSARALQDDCEASPGLENSEIYRIRKEDSMLG